ncbi:YcxB family protein [Streptomyces sp. NBC_01260]|uniref:YcxB family protein n=1 Tax=unclassified Streptomyces TaxID=2593676 RepID=UPI000F4651B2|nr:MULTISPECIES: YcxB family protein [unclassified Streptomyces]MCX4774521.1 YcxB family protein [Streptomyces sp. NBC_01285]
MDDIRQTTITFSGILTREEFDEALAATGWLRRLRWLIVVAAAVMAALSLKPSADGNSINAGLLMLALVYGALGMFLPPMLAGRMFRADQATGEKQAVIDDAGFVLSRGSDELMRVPWRTMSRYYETERVYVVTGRLGWKRGLLMVPKRLLTRTGETELVGVLLEASLRRSTSVRTHGR